MDFNKFIENYLNVLRKYFNFEGRASRSEFWMFVLVNFIISLVLGIISKGLGNLYSLAVLCPSLGVGARRLHDINKTGWWQLLALIPVVGWIILLIWAAQPGDASTNEYGVNSQAPTPAITTPPSPSPSVSEQSKINKDIEKQ